MKRLFATLLLLIACAASVTAAVPNKDAVPAYAEEQTILQQEKDVPEPGLKDFASGRRHADRHWIIPIGRDPESDVILQRGGNTWRTIRNGPLGLAAGTILLLGALAVLALWGFGVRADEPPASGRRVQRFSRWQRWVHWTTAISFIVLAVTGLLILFGKVLLIPLLGHTAFSWLAIISKYVHNIAGPFFVLCTLVMFATFVHHNFFERADWAWIRKAGGLLSRGHPPPAPYFNAGEKAWFWGGVVLLGLVMSITGLVLDFVVADQTRYMLQIANWLHIGAGALYMVAAMGHIYIGTAGTPGAYQAMREGTVDENWARAHHSLWLERSRR
jgi:formate dehydrogenase subunit gamma